MGLVSLLTYVYSSLPDKQRQDINEILAVISLHVCFCGEFDFDFQNSIGSYLFQRLFTIY